MLIEATSDIATKVTGAIRGAARATGASFDYLVKTAQRESALNPNAKARTSSATGLFQFIEQTWLQTLKKSGAALGYGRYADSIQRTDSGRYVVTDPAQRNEIMALRKDPVAASAMAGAFTQSNAAFLQDKLGRAPTDGELYIAHFLGPGGALQLIKAAEQNPQGNAANLFPKAAAANRSIFYGKGAPRSAAQVYGVLVAKHQNTRTPAPAGEPVTQIAQAPQAAPGATQTAAQQRRAAAVAVATALDTDGANSGGARPLAFADSGPGFHGLFRTEPGAPVSAVVSEIWTVGRTPTASAAQPADAPAPAGRRPLELFHFLHPYARNRSA